MEQLSDLKRQRDCIAAEVDHFQKERNGTAVEFHKLSQETEEMRVTKSNEQMKAAQMSNDIASLKGELVRLKEVKIFMSRMHSMENRKKRDRKVENFNFRENFFLAVSDKNRQLFFQKFFYVEISPKNFSTFRSLFFRISILCINSTFTIFPIRNFFTRNPRRINKQSNFSAARPNFIKHL